MGTVVGIIAGIGGLIVKFGLDILLVAAIILVARNIFSR